MCSKKKEEKTIAIRLPRKKKVSGKTASTFFTGGGSKKEKGLAIEIREKRRGSRFDWKGGRGKSVVPAFLSS